MRGGITAVALSGVPVGWLVWQRPPTAPVLTVTCRATFVLQPGEAALAPEQEAPSAVEQPYSDASSRAVRTPADGIPNKPRADVLLVGHAFAPKGQQVRSLIARIAVGEIDKRIEVFCDRHFDLQGALREGPRFTHMPLVYERAAGGPDTVNPLGVRPDTRDGYGRLALPNLQPPGLEVAKPSDVIPPVGFGPIASTWPSRRSLLGPTLAGRPPADWNGQQVPPDLDPSHFNAAPRDQQAAALHDDERIVLENLHPWHAELVTRLPGLRPRAFAKPKGGTPVPVAMRADTLWIDTSRGLCTLSWRGHLPLEHAGPDLRVFVAMEHASRPLSWDDVDRLRSRGPDPAPAPPPPKGDDPLNRTITDPVSTAPALLESESPPERIAGEPMLSPARRVKRATLPFFVPGQGGAGGPQAPAADGAGLPFRRTGASEAPPAAPPAVRPVSSPQEYDETLDEETAHDTSTALPGAPEAPPAASPSPWASGASAFPSPGGGPSPTPLSGGGLSGTPLSGGGLSGVPLSSARGPVARSPMPLDRGPSGGARVRDRAGSGNRAPVTEALSLAAFDPRCLPRLRKDPRFVDLLEALDEQPLDDDLDRPEDVGDPAELEDRREVFEILARGEVVSEEAAVETLAAAVHEDGWLAQAVAPSARRWPFLR
ncbi:MAG: DUF2169 domain-containing protein [Polyangiaceae bacterium]